MTESEFLREWKLAEPKVKTILGHRKVSADDIEDIVMETWLKCYNSRHTCEQTKFKQWVMIVALNKHIDLIRKPDQRAFRLDAPRQFDLPGGRETFASDLEDRNLGHKPFYGSFPFWFYKLPANYQEVARLRACGYSVEEIAGKLGETISAVKTRLYRTKKEAARLLELEAQKSPTCLG